MSDDSEFQHARERLLARYGNNRNAAFRELRSKKFVSKITLYRLFDSKIRDDEFLAPTREKVIEFAGVTASSRLYFRIAKLVKAGDDEITKLTKYLGRYRYFRKSVSKKITSGIVDIVREGDIYKFYHSNSDKPAKFPLPKFDHEGFVFQLGTRLHLLGLGPRYIRPIVAEECADISLEPINGFVIATAIPERGSRLFAARFMMFHESHPNYNLSLDDPFIDATLDETGVEHGILEL
jgi:hypothetical protein